MLFGALVRGPLLYVPNVGAQPEPPVRFNVNVQGLVGVLEPRARAPKPTARSISTHRSRRKRSRRWRTRPRRSTACSSTISSRMDADRRGREFLFVSRGGELRAARQARRRTASSTSSTPRTRRVRFQTGNLPSGVVMSRDGKRAYTNNELNTSITAIDLANNQVLARDIESSTPPAPGTVEHRRLVRQARVLHRARRAGRDRRERRWQLRRRVARHRSAAASEQGLRQRLVELRVVPRRRPLGQRDLDLRDRTAPDDSARRHVRAPRPQRSAPA